MLRWHVRTGLAEVLDMSQTTAGGGNMQRRSSRAGKIPGCGCLVEGEKALGFKVFNQDVANTPSLEGSVRFHAFPRPILPPTTCERPGKGCANSTVRSAGNLALSDHEAAVMGKEKRNKNIRWKLCRYSAVSKTEGP